MCSGIVWWNWESKQAMFFVLGRVSMQYFTISRAGELCRGARSVRASMSSTVSGVRRFALG